MDKFIDARFDRVEKALTTLIDSVAKYNPSTALADDLLAADKELSDGLEQLQIHQNNDLRIQALRADVAALDAQIKATILALAASRKDILATPATVFPEDDPIRRRGPKPKNYEFTYDQLMSYARRISRNTVPAPGQTDGSEIFGHLAGAGGGAATAETGPATAAGTPAATTPGTTVNGAGTPGPTSAGGAQSMDVDTPAAAGASAAPSTTASASAAVTTTAAAAAAAATTTVTATPVPFSSAMGPPAHTPDVLPTDYQQYISPTTGTVFLPWPMPDLMLNGGLRALSAATTDRKDGGSTAKIRFVGLEEQRAREAEEKQRAEREAEAREAREEQQRRMAAEAVHNFGSRSGGGGGGRPAAAAPTQFALTLDMDDD